MGIPIAGELKEKGGGDLDAKWVRLAADGSNTDSEKEGLRLTMNGGWTIVDKKKRPQKAIVEFICDKNLEGTENLWDPEDKYEEKVKRAEGDDKKDDEPEKDVSQEPSLKFVRYDTSGDVEDILRLEWRKMHAKMQSRTRIQKRSQQDGDSLPGLSSSLSSPPRLILSSAPGSITTDTVLEAGTLSLTAIPSETSHISSKTGCEGF